MVSRNTLLLWLLGLLITVMITSGGVQVSLLMGVKEQIAGYNYRFIMAETNRADMKKDVAEMKSALAETNRRITRLERFELGHKENER